MVLVANKMDIATVVRDLTTAYNNAGRNVRVWGFDADPKKEENYAELRRIRENSE